MVRKDVRRGTRRGISSEPSSNASKRAVSTILATIFWLTRGAESAITSMIKGGIAKLTIKAGTWKEDNTNISYGTSIEKPMSILVRKIYKVALNAVHRKSRESCAE